MKSTDITKRINRRIDQLKADVTVLNADDLLDLLNNLDDIQDLINDFLNYLGEVNKIQQFYQAIYPSQPNEVIK